MPLDRLGSLYFYIITVEFVRILMNHFYYVCLEKHRVKVTMTEIKCFRNRSNVEFPQYFFDFIKFILFSRKRLNYFKLFKIFLDFYSLVSLSLIYFKIFFLFVEKTPDGLLVPFSYVFFRHVLFVHWSKYYRNSYPQKGGRQMKTQNKYSKNTYQINKGHL